MVNRELGQHAPRSPLSNREFGSDPPTLPTQTPSAPPAGFLVFGPLPATVLGFILCESPIAADPGEEPLDNPASRQNGEADLIGMLADDLDDDAGGGGNPLAGISAIGEDAFDEGEDTARGVQKRSAAVAILDARRMRFEDEAAPIRVDEDVALAALDL